MAHGPSGELMGEVSERLGGHLGDLALPGTCKAVDAIQHRRGNPCQHKEILPYLGRTLAGAGGVGGALSTTRSLNILSKKPSRLFIEPELYSEKREGGTV